MKKFLLVLSLLVMSLWLVSCWKSDAPLTEAQQAEKYGLSLEEYKEQKDAAARMNMTIEDHLKMWHSEDMDHSNMDISDDSHMIEDDIEANDIKKHMDTMHAGEDIKEHGAETHNTYK